MNNHQSIYGCFIISCKKCKDIKERSDVPHIVRNCEGCGRKLHIARCGEYGKGINRRQWCEAPEGRSPLEIIKNYESFINGMGRDPV
ncbi:MAG: hypothetical protein ACOCZT_00745 [Halanaerobiales bacterium]